MPKQAPSKKLNPKSRIFVGALPLTADKKSLKSYFEAFGKVSRIQLGINRKTKERMGFAFIDFKKAETLELVLSQEHYFNGRDIDVKPFEPASTQIKAERDACLSRRVHVKAIPEYVQREELFAAMADQFGPVERAFIMYNQGTGETRGFGFVTFIATDIAEYAVSTGYVTIGEENLQISYALPRGREGFQYKKMLSHHLSEGLDLQTARSTLLGLHAPQLNSCSNCCSKCLNTTGNVPLGSVNLTKPKHCGRSNVPFKQVTPHESANLGRFTPTNLQHKSSYSKAIHTASLTTGSLFARTKYFDHEMQRIAKHLSKRWSQTEALRFNVTSAKKLRITPKRWEHSSVTLDEQF